MTRWNNSVFTMAEYSGCASMTSLLYWGLAGLRGRGPPSDTLNGSTLYWKSGVLVPSGRSTTHWVISTPGILDVLRITAEQKQQSRYTIKNKQRVEWKAVGLLAAGRWRHTWWFVFYIRCIDNDMDMRRVIVMEHIDGDDHSTSSIYHYSYNTIDIRHSGEIYTVWFFLQYILWGTPTWYCIFSFFFIW